MVSEKQAEAFIISIIDDFTSVNDPNLYPAILPASSSSVDFTESGLSDVLGGKRIFSMKNRSDLPAVGQSEANIVPASGVFNFTTTAENFSCSIVTAQLLKKP